MKCDFQKELLTGYLDAELEAGERASVEAHLKTCEECRGQMETLRSAVAAMASLGSEKAPASIREGIQREISVGRAAADRRGTFRPVWVKYAAAAVLFLGLSVFVFEMLESDIKSGREEASHRHAEADRSSVRKEDPASLKKQLSRLHGKNDSKAWGPEGKALNNFGADKKVGEILPAPAGSGMNAKSVNDPALKREGPLAETPILRADQSKPDAGKEPSALGTLGISKSAEKDPSSPKAGRAETPVAGGGKGAASEKNSSERAKSADLLADVAPLREARARTKERTKTGTEKEAAKPDKARVVRVRLDKTLKGQRELFRFLATAKSKAKKNDLFDSMRGGRVEDRVYEGEMFLLSQKDFETVSALLEKSFSADRRTEKELSSDDLSSVISGLLADAGKGRKKGAPTTLSASRSARSPAMKKSRSRKIKKKAELEEQQEERKPADPSERAAEILKTSGVVLIFEFVEPAPEEKPKK